MKGTQMKRFHMIFAATVLASAAPVAFAQMNYSAPAPAAERKIEAPRQEVPKDTATAEAVKIAVEQPKAKCEDPGAYPGRVGMQTEERRNKFIKAVDTYKTCMMNFVEERKAVIKANETAARAGIEQFNATMKRLGEEQEKARE
jgi:hypothetical protein